MAGEIAALTAVVNGLADTSQNIALLVNQQGAMIKDLQAGAVDLTPIANAVTALGAIKTSLDEAIVANTPAPPAP